MADKKIDARTDDDVEGHSYTRAPDGATRREPEGAVRREPEGAVRRVAGEDDDVEGHSYSRSGASKGE